MKLSLNPTFVFMALSLLLTSHVANGQFQLSRTVNGTALGDSLGYSSDGLGDINQDGYPDFVVGAIRSDVNGQQSGSATVYSGLDGSQIFQFDGDEANDFFGASVRRSDDMNGDGIDEIIVGAPGTGAMGIGINTVGYVKIFSGADGTLIHHVTSPFIFRNFGFSVSGVPDLSGDGIPDFLVGAPGFGILDINPGFVVVYSGANGALIGQSAGFIHGSSFGFSVAGLSDIDGDGLGDIVVGAPLEEIQLSFYAGSARVYSGGTGDLLYFYNGRGNYSPFQGEVGHTVASAGDVDRDGVEDFVFGARLDSQHGSQSGSVAVVSGATGSIIHRFLGPNQYSYLGFSVDGAGDVNGDGHDDIVVGSPISGPFFASGGHVEVYSGKDGQILEQITDITVADFFGFSVCGVGDMNLDGFDDILIGAPGFGVDDNIPSRFEIHQAPTLPTNSYSSQFDHPPLLLDWLPRDGDPYSTFGRLSCRRASVFASGAVAVSLAPGDFLLAPGAPLLLAVDPVNLVDGGPFLFDQAGKVESLEFSRQQPAVAGSNFYFQFFELSPQPASSNAVKILMIP